MNPGISVIARRINSGHFSCYLICKSVFGGVEVSFFVRWWNVLDRFFILSDALAAFFR